MLLENEGAGQQADNIRAAIAADMEERALAAEQGQPLQRSTSQIGDAIAARL